MLITLRKLCSAAAAAVCCVALLSSGCGESGPDARREKGANGRAALAGEVAVDGSSTVYPMTEAVANAFESEYPKVTVRVGKSGTGGGFKAFTSGETDISDASRPITADEFESCRQNNVSFIELPVAYDGLTIVVNPRNDWVDQLTIEQLQKIYLEEHAARSWSELDSSWPDVAIKVYSPGTDSGTFDYFKEVVAPDDQPIRGDMSTSEEDNDLVRGVAGDRGSTGYFGASYYFNNRDQLRAVPIVDPKTGQAVTPTPETIESGDYAPFSRPLFIYVNVDELRRPELRKFVEFYLDRAADVARHVDYVPLPDSVYAAAREHYDQRWAGTHYLTADGAKRTGPLVEVYRRENLVTTTGE